MDYLSLLQQPFFRTVQNPATKAIDLSPAGDFWYSAVRDEDNPSGVDLLRAVPWLWRAVELRANAVAAMPFAIMAGETERDNSADYANALGWLPDPRRLLWLTEAALCIYGAAYYWRERNRVATKAVRYVRPDTVEPQIDPRLGLTGFVRTVNGQRIAVPVDGITYIWRGDPAVELGPPSGSPVMAALAAAGVLHYMDRFAGAYFQRGAIKATLLTVSGAPVAAERDRLKSWWGNLMSGIRNAFATEIINADSVTPVVIGEGLAELNNATLTSEKRQDIATALGVPQSVIFSESAGGLGGAGVATMDERHFYDKTIIPETELIAEAWNSQLLAPLGLRIEFRPETLDVYQEDENQRAAAFATYVNAGLPLEVAGPMVGLELPAGGDWDKLAALKEERRAQMATQLGGQEPEQPEEEDAEDDAKALADLRRWRVKSIKRGRLAPFDSAHIPAALMADVIGHGANGWRDALDNVIAVYDGEEPEPVKTLPDVSALVGALQQAAEALLHGQPQHTN